MDFFGNVQGVEIGTDGGRVSNESEWREDLRRLGEIWRRTMESEDGVRGNKTTGTSTAAANPTPRTQQEPLHPSAIKIQPAAGWVQQFLGAGALAGCAILWGGAWWLEGGRGGGGGGNLRRSPNQKKA